MDADNFCPDCEQLGETCDECRAGYADKYSDERYQDSVEGK